MENYLNSLFKTLENLFYVNLIYEYTLDLFSKGVSIQLPHYRCEQLNIG